jgi:TetR/AcrR family transcriptional repressor of nem operon
MTAAGLTHGGFYRHFDSKEQLVAEACGASAGRLAADVATILSGRAKRKGRAVAATYLSTAHRDDPANGCTLAALGSELARSDEATRATVTKGFLRLVNVLAGDSKGCPPKVARRRALAAASTMVGAMTMARIVTDPDLSVAILRSAAKSISG